MDICWRFRTNAVSLSRWDISMVVFFLVLEYFFSPFSTIQRRFLGEEVSRWLLWWDNGRKIDCWCLNSVRNFCSS